MSSLSIIRTNNPDTQPSPSSSNSKHILSILPKELFETIFKEDLDSSSNITTLIDRIGQLCSLNKGYARRVPLLIEDFLPDLNLVIMFEGIVCPTKFSMTTSKEDIRKKASAIRTSLNDENYKEKLMLRTELIHQEVLQDSNKLKMTKIPEEITYFSNVQTLVFSNNKIIEIPESIASLTKLKTLYLDRNRIRKIPAFMKELQNLKELILSNNKITEIPEELTILPLENLHLNGNQITKVPDSMKNFTQLKSLDLSKNQITAIPPSLGFLTKLETLHLANNPYENNTIPPSFGHLRNLDDIKLDPTFEIPWDVRIYDSCLKQVEKRKLRDIKSKRLHGYAAAKALPRLLRYLYIYTEEERKIIDKDVFEGFICPSSGARITAYMIGLYPAIQKYENSQQNTSLKFDNFN